MATIDKTTPPAAVGLAAVLSGATPRDLLLAVGGGAAIAPASPGTASHRLPDLRLIWCADQAITSAIGHHVQVEQQPGNDGQAGTLAPVG